MIVCDDVVNLNISIHAPPRGATRQRKQSPDSAFTAFQFTPLREGRPHHEALFPAGQDISIHAPPRGATSPPKSRRFDRTISIHAPPRGATRNMAVRAYPEKMISIHAPPRGATLVHGVCWGYWNLISIHAPPRGATPRLYGAGRVGVISIHAPPRGATPTSTSFP